MLATQLLPFSAPWRSPGEQDHYGTWYGREPLPHNDDRPLTLVYGNCQAESLRVLLAPHVLTVRMPPVHELRDAEVELLRHWLGRADVLVTQPVAANYRNLPLGTADISPHLRPEAQLIKLPVFRYAGLYPAHVIVRHKSVGDPPLAPYHDIRTLAKAAGITLTKTAAEAAPDLHELSLYELRKRELAHETLTISDLLEEPTAATAHTINHPGNPILLAMATRVLHALGVSGPAKDPGRELLRSIYAPLAGDVLTALGAPCASREGWTIGAEKVSTSQVERLHVKWYEQNPQVVEAGIKRHGDTLDLWGAR